MKFPLLLLETTTTTAEETSSISWESVLQKLVDWCTTSGIKLLVSIVVLILSFSLINLVAKRIEKNILVGKKKKKSKVEEQSKKHLRPNPDKTLVKTLLYIARIVLKILVVIGIIGYLGIDTTAVSSLVASLGVCVGLAVNGALSNFAGGVMILITRPFRVDDYIEACGYSGTVEDIHIVFTILRTPDNKVVYVPNGTLSAATIVNYSVKDIRRVDLSYSIAYGSDVEKAKEVLLTLCNSHEKVLDDPAPMCRLSNQGESALSLVVRVWVKSADYWDVFFDLQESSKKVLDENNIKIPFNQLDVHIKND